MTWRIQLFKLNYDGEEALAVGRVLESGWLTMGERVLEFENAFGEMLGTGVVDCLAVASCTAALHMALLACEVGPGDEVIIPGLTFVADANVVRFCGGKPVFADCISASDLTIDPVDLARKITDRTKAVIVVHYAGYPCAMDELLKVCRKNGLMVIEDVAHAPGGVYEGRRLGTLGDIGCFSFFSNKNLSVGEGGMLSFQDPAVGSRLRNLRSHGMTTLTMERHMGRAYSYDVVEPGLNYRMDEIHAALGLVQLRKLFAGNARRRELTGLYRELLAESAVLAPFANVCRGESAHHIMPVLLPEQCNRERVMELLRADGIQSSIHYPPFWRFRAYADVDSGSTPQVRSIAARQLTLPLYPGMAESEVRVVCQALLEASEKTSR